jgi:sec-independent protein translocase protein TatB
MFDIGWSELLVVAIVAIVVVGPKDLPRLMRTFGVYAGKLRRAAADFQRQFQEAMAESEVDEVAKNIEAIRANMGTVADFGNGPDKPVMMPTMPAPQSIEQAIAPAPAKAQVKRAPRKKASVAKAGTKKAAAKKAPTKAAQASRKPPARAAAKKTTAKTRSRSASTTKTRPKR